MKPNILIVCITCLASIVGAASGYVGACLKCESSRVMEGPVVHEEIRTKELLLVDDDGNPCAGFTTYSPEGVRLWLQRGESDTPLLSFTVDQLEGTPTARITARTKGASPEVSSAATLTSVLGISQLTLHESKAQDQWQSIVIGSTHEGDTTALRTTSDGSTVKWP